MTKKLPSSLKNKYFLILFVLIQYLGFAQTTITKTYNGSGVSVDNGTITLSPVEFSLSDFPGGCAKIKDISVSINWTKVTGTCDNPGSGGAYHSETSFGLISPLGSMILASTGTWSSNGNINYVTTVFNNISTNVPSGKPTDGTFQPNGGSFAPYINQSAIGLWSLTAGDSTPADPLCIRSYSITITTDVSNTVAAASSTPTLCINTALTNITHATTGATGIDASTGLPAGVTAAFGSNKITISGMPTVSGIFNYSIPLTGGCGTSSAIGTITVKENTAAAASSTPTQCINTALTNITHATTGATGIGAATGLPGGVTAAFGSNTITISGTPTASGVFNYSIPLTGGCGNVEATGTITVTPNNTASAASSAPTLCINKALTNITHTTTGATGIGAATGLPAGVTAAFGSNTITISGTPTASGTFNYSIPLTGGCGAVNATGTITVTPKPTKVSTPITICSGASYTWSVNNSVYTAAGTYLVTNDGCTADQELVLTVTPKPAAPTTACYETATFNTATCNWEVTGTQPIEPTTALACWQTRSFNTTTCAWEVTGTQTSQPTVLNSVCNSDSKLTIDLKTLLPVGTPINGTWTDVDNTGKLEASIFSPFGLNIRDYDFEYKVADGNCPLTIKINISDDCGSIVLGCGIVSVHNAFSPNGDGINENFIIDNIDDINCYPDNSVEIYNRWGVMVFETTGYNNTTRVFNGVSQGRTTISDSSGLPTGTYFYILNYTSIDNNGNLLTNKKDGYLYITK